jgi:hypothetical protein
MPFSENTNWSTKLEDGIMKSQKGSVREDEIGGDDSTWILTSAFIIFTMQSG